MTLNEEGTAEDLIGDLIGLDSTDAHRLWEAICSGHPTVVATAKETVKGLPAETRAGLLNYFAFRDMSRTLREVRGDQRALRAEHDRIMSGESKSGCRHLADTNQKVAIIETKMLIYAGIAGFVLSPITSVLTAALFKRLVN